MPLYEYKCQACDHEFEEFQKFSDKPIKKCPECGKLKVAKKISLTAFHLKGEGWYKDGYARPSEKPKEKEKEKEKTKEKKSTKSDKKSSNKKHNK